MSDHMQKQITSRMLGWAVETRDAGTCYVPADVVDVPEYIKTGAVISIDDAGADQCAHALAARLQDYVEGRDFISIEAVEGYFGRWSAPGYMDCTDWQFARSLRDIRAALTEMQS